MTGSPLPLLIAPVGGIRFRKTATLIASKEETMTTPVLYDYWRSSASYRVRIALNLMGIAYETVPVDLLTAEHRSETHRARNPQGLLPALDIDGRMFTQSLAIIEYLDETRPGAGLLPKDPEERARVRALSYAIAMEIHPICNTSVAAHVVDITGGGEEARVAWMRHFIGPGLANFEAMLADGGSGRFCHGDTPTMADICLMPQMFNARRWGADIEGLRLVTMIADNCEELESFAAAHPDRIGPPPK
jgi:maleylacetoacetate isomerase